MSFNFRDVGGILYIRAGGDASDPNDQLWNFGIMGLAGAEGPVIPDSTPALYDVAPHIQGRWDGKTSICCHDAARKVLGNPLPAQLQPAGTCGGRTGKQSSQLLQTILIAAGRRAKYHKTSHAWLYAMARREYGMLGSGDGVPDGSIPPIMAKYGLLNADEAGDTADYGDGSDDLARRWGRTGPPKEMLAAAEDNKVEATLVRVRSVQELCDGYASGGVGLVSSMRGFTMARDADGLCRATGTWAHYMTGSGVSVKGGRGRPVIDQSWGRNTPSGPMVEDGRWPDYSFATDPDIVERDMIKGGSFHMIFGVSKLWDEDQVIDPIDWTNI